MIPKIIKKEKDYERALPRINDLMDADLDTPEGDKLAKSGDTLLIFSL